MAETGLTLFVDLEQGSRIDLEVAARASLAWVELIRTVGVDIDPFSEWRVELESSTPGSLKIRSIIKLNSEDLRVILLSTLTSSLVFIFKETIAWGISEVMDYMTGDDAPEEVRLLSDEDRLAVAEDVLRRLQASFGRAEAEKVYDALEKDERVRGAGATAHPERRPSTVVRRERFPSQMDAEPEPEKFQRTTIEAMELTLIRPVLTSDPKRKWQFLSLYGTFGAAIQDQKFLSDLAEGRLNIPMSQGIRMIVEIEVTEERDGELWRPVDRVIRKVIEVIPPVKQPTLFDSDDAE